MRYWVVKGKGKPHNDWHRMLKPGTYETWHTGKPPKGDRVFCWESSPVLKLVGLAEISSTDQGRDENKDQLFRLRYRSRYLRVPLFLKELRSFPPLSGASFLRAVSGTVFPLTPSQGESLFELLVRIDPKLGHIWPDVIEIPDLDGVLEGRLVPTSHLRRERDQDLVARKKESVLESHGRLACEVCGFNFAEKYGPLGEDFCEVHHLKPLAGNEGEVVTNLADLAVVCSNCHRVLHRRSPMMGIKQLYQLIEDD